eukprot:gene4093-14194_t
MATWPNGQKRGRGVPDSHPGPNGPRISKRLEELSFCEGIAHVVNSACSMLSELKLRLAMMETASVSRAAAEARSPDLRSDLADEAVSESMGEVARKLAEVESCVASMELRQSRDNWRSLGSAVEESKQDRSRNLETGFGAGLEATATTVPDWSTHADAPEKLPGLSSRTGPTNLADLVASLEHDLPYFATQADLPYPASQVVLPEGPYAGNEGTYPPSAFKTGTGCRHHYDTEEAEGEVSYSVDIPYDFKAESSMGRSYDAGNSMNETGTRHPYDTHNHVEAGYVGQHSYNVQDSIEAETGSLHSYDTQKHVEVGSVSFLDGVDAEHAECRGMQNSVDAEAVGHQRNNAHDSVEEKAVVLQRYNVLDRIEAEHAERRSMQNSVDAEAVGPTLQGQRYRAFAIDTPPPDYGFDTNKDFGVFPLGAAPHGPQLYDDHTGSLYLPMSACVSVGMEAQRLLYMRLSHEVVLR